MLRHLQQNLQLNEDLQKLQQRLKKIQNKSTPTKMKQLTNLQIKYIKIEQKYNQLKKIEQLTIKNIEMEVQMLQKQSGKNKNIINKNYDYNEELIGNLEKSMAQINHMSPDLKNMRTNLSSAMEKKFRAIKTETTTIMNQQFQSRCNEAKQQIQSELQKVKQHIQQEQKHRDQTAQFMMATFGDEIEKLKEILKQQQEMRQSQYSELNNFIFNVEDCIVSNIQRERKQSYKAIELLENKLQSVCFKIEAKVLVQ